MADLRGGDGLVGWARSAYTWWLLQPVSRGFWLAALVFLVLVTVANAADGDWLSAVVGSLLVGVVCVRLWNLHRAGRPPSGQARTASR